MTDEHKNGDETDEQLIILAKNGDESAFHKLVKRKTGLLYHIASDWLNKNMEYFGDIIQAGDIVNETLVKVFETLHRFELRENPQKQFNVWLGTIVINLCRNYRRNRRNRVTTNLPDDNDYESPKYEPFYSEDASKKVEETEQRDILREEIKKLPANLKEVVTLRMEEKKVKEIAQILSISKGEVSKRFNEAIELLKQSMLVKFI
jgi:RNA polymerase sigma factor (sigma-70 family)